LIEAQKHGYGNAETAQMIEKGLQWLEKTRHPDGGCSEALNLNIWDTALSVITLLDVGMLRDEDVIQKACNWLIENQNPDGGWAFSGVAKVEGYSHLPSDADDSALATLALLRASFSGSHDAVSRGLNWLREHQGKDGSWGTYVLGAGDVGCVSITAHAIEACFAAEGMEEERKRAILWLKKNIQKDGYWSDLWLAKNTYGTACALSALIKAGERDCPEVERGINWLQQTQNADGGWGEDMFGNPAESTVEQTAWSVYSLLLADKDNASAKRGIEFLLNSQGDDGSWKPNCVGIYWEIIGGYIDPIYSAVFPLLALKEGRTDFIR
jgi:squalene-hopene/tetraprenyl-beta-curcumene cyclase